MNADGSKGVEVRVRAGAELAFLDWVGAALLAAGALFLACGAATISLGAREQTASRGTAGA